MRRARRPEPARDTATPLADRLALQFDLAWSGDYNGLVNGEINDKTTAAIKTFQHDRKLKETGVLNPQERALLAAAAKAKQAQVGWSLVDDPVTGARIGLPTKQVPNKSQTKNGTRWSSAQGQVQVETFKIREPGTTLAAVYEQQKKEPATRKLEVNFLRPDFFILSGMQNLKKFYVRAEIRDGEVRGMTVLYDQAAETIMDPVVVVMSSAFTPFPGVSGVATCRSDSQAQGGVRHRHRRQHGRPHPHRPAAHRRLQRDRGERIWRRRPPGGGQGRRPRAAADLWRARSRARDVSARLPKVPTSRFSASPIPQSQGGGSAISAMAAKARGETVEPAPQLGFSGGAALDGQGRLVGMVELRTTAVANAGAASPQPLATLVPAPTIRAFLEAQRLAPAAAGPPRRRCRQGLAGAGDLRAEIGRGRPDPRVIRC